VLYVFKVFVSLGLQSRNYNIETAEVKRTQVYESVSVKTKT
jgi:hypothetical protein